MNDMAQAISAWSNGDPQDESALMNQMTGRLRRNRGRCDVGTGCPVIMTAQYFRLHRKGSNQTDKYGSDFAVTIDIPHTGLVKTTLFQLKIGAANHVSLEKEQLTSAQSVGLLQDRTFVITVNRDSHSMRLRSAKLCAKEFSNNQCSKDFCLESWDWLVEWLPAWFRCEKAPASDADTKIKVEDILDGFRAPPPRDMVVQVLRNNVRDGFVPARAWMKYRFDRKEPNAS